MATIIDPAEEQGERPVATAVRAHATPDTPTTVTTTLYDLIATIQDIVGPGNDRLVVATVAHILDAGYITLPSDMALQRGEQLACIFPSGQERPYMAAHKECTGAPVILAHALMARVMQELL